LRCPHGWGHWTDGPRCARAGPRLASRTRDAGGRTAWLGAAPFSLLGFRDSARRTATSPGRRRTIPKPPQSRSPETREGRTGRERRYQSLLRPCSAAPESPHARHPAPPRPAERDVWGALTAQRQRARQTARGVHTWGHHPQYPLFFTQIRVLDSQGPHRRAQLRFGAPRLPSPAASATSARTGRCRPRRA
jgi:hypothetical protein